MKTALSFLFILLAVQISANDLIIVEPSNDVLDQFLDDDISFQNIDDLSKVLNTDKQKFKRYKIKEYIKEAPTTPKIQYAVLMKNSSLYKLDKDVIIKNPSKMYVSAREVLYGGKWSYIYDKKKNAKYRTLTKNLAFLEEVIKLRSTIAGNKIYPKKNKYHSVDRSIPVEMHFIYRSESTDFKTLNTLATDELETAKSNSLSIKSYFNSLLPIDLGLVFDYQSGIVESESDSITWSSISIGPTIKYDFYSYGDLVFNTQFAVKKSLLFNATSEFSSASYSSLAWQLGVEAAYKTKYGSFSLGIENSFIKTSIKGELQNQASFSNSKETINQSALTVGYQYTWIL
ncbi:hypothetical protein [Halobacteriovorax sp.]|uniref:hypothetical protein n=1 Tax=Halobacteriovorax sp. TaxID=2020862 RepID=UPI0035621126